MAETYVRRCYEVGLEIVGLTEHNLNPPSCPSLIPDLRDAAKRISGEFGYEIVIFPGFEVAVPIGGGLHVLCLFEPATAVELVSEKLTLLGLPSDKRFTEGSPNPVPQGAHLTLDKLLKVVQEDVDTPGLVVMAHASGNSGVLDPKTISQWWSQAVVRDERVLCLELPKSREAVLEGPQNLLRSILQNSDPRYERQHPIASVMSSDCKALLPSDSEHNFIGYRHTWLKMGSPTIEGLRQAFLDHGSRVRFGDARPEDAYTYPRIDSLEVAGARFLEDQTLTFSPNLNVLIGGSGTGKSTIAQYLRLLFDQATGIRGDDVRTNYERCLETVEDTTRITARVVLDGQAAAVESIGSTSGSVRAPDSEIDGKEVAGVFPVRFFGQREIYNIADDRAATVALLDDLNRSDLSALDRKANELQTRYRENAAAAQGVSDLRRELGEVAADLASKQIKVRRIESEAAPLQQLSVANDLVQTVAEVLVDSRRAVELLLPENRPPAVLPEPRADEDARLQSVRRSVAEAQVLFDSKIRSAVEEFQATITSLISSQTVVSLERDACRLREETEPVLKDLAERGIELEQYENYRADVVRLNDEAEAIGLRIKVSEAAETMRVQLLSEIHAVWAEEVTIRTESATRLNAAVPTTAKGTPFVEVTVEPFADDRAFNRVVEEHRGDRRKLSDDDWALLIESVVEAANRVSPIDVLVDWIRQLRSGTTPPGLAIRDTRHQQRILDCFPDAVLHELEITRIRDRVRVLLRREDGSDAGDLEGGLSVGQKCTAVLALLLALDVAPVIIDQPEDDIDNEFTYSEVVPLLRKVKERRQLIIVTHDPNIPVNADAEMIHALAAIGGKGAVKVVDGLEAVGSLDHAHVRVAVEEIMEGSEKAFRRRFAKYGF